MQKPRKLLAAVLVVGLVLVAGYIVGQNMGRGSNASPQPLPTVPRSSPIQIPEPQPKVPKLPKATPGPKAPRLKDAVMTVILDHSVLSQAQLMAPQQLKQVVTTTVVPEKQQDLIRAFSATGPILAETVLQYTSVSSARLEAQYTVSTQKYRVSFFNGRRATVWLYTVSHWIDGKSREFYIPSLTVVQVRWVNGRWLYAGAHDPPPAAVPVPRANLSFEQSVRRFQPFLRRFKSYASS